MRWWKADRPLGGPLRFRLGAGGAVLVATVCFAADSRGAPIVASDDAPLVDLAKGYARLERTFVTRENGLFLDPIGKPEEVATIEGFFAQTANDDFQSFTGKHPFDVLASYDEHGDEGNFAGIASVGIAARLMVLRKEGAPAAEIAIARDAAVRAAIAWHAYGAIGGPGVVARGVRRVTPAGGDPPFPGPAPEIVPLKDGGGSPLPADKHAVWRAPVAPGFDGWVWFDDTSKDQVSGYALAAAWLWDALHDDPMVDPKIAQDLADDLNRFARALMKVSPEHGIDLCLRDADGRLTSFNDLNPRSLSPDGEPLPEDYSLKNGFNALLALGIIRAAYHVSGDPEVGAYYYSELVGRRRMAEDPTTTLSFMYLGAATNYSNVNMAAIGLATLGRFETDPYVRERLGVTLDAGFWSAGSDRDASHVEQAWFDAIYGAYSASAPADIPARVSKNLSGFPPAPGFQRDRVNCDDAELAAKSCVAIDGTTILHILDETGHGGGPVAADILPMSIRPDSDFMWRSDPHSPNGHASTLMDPRGDWLAAYWLGRISTLATPVLNVSPFARPALPYTLGEGGAGGASSGTGGGAPLPSDEGCACSVTSARTDPRPLLTGAAMALGLCLRRARRRRSSMR
ncbi:MAG: hypothetical protein U0414_17840 [Polyangiaceae bacterium]